MIKTLSFLSWRMIPVLVAALVLAVLALPAFMPASRAQAQICPCTNPKPCYAFSTFFAMGHPPMFTRCDKDWQESFGGNGYIMEDVEYPCICLIYKDHDFCVDSLDVNCNGNTVDQIPCGGTFIGDMPCDKETYIAKDILEQCVSF